MIKQRITHSLYWVMAWMNIEYSMMLHRQTQRYTDKQWLIEIDSEVDWQINRSKTECKTET